MKRAAIVLCVTVFASFISGAAAAGLFRAYLSVNGNDANPCTVDAPCRLLTAALNAVNDGGEVWIMDSANYNVSQVNIDKSVTILAIPGALGSLVATGGGDALFVSASGAKVTLRNLVIVPLGTSSDGIGSNMVGELTVEDCEISGMAGNGIAVFDVPAKVTVRNTVLRGNASAGFYARGVALSAILDGVRTQGGNWGVVADSGPHVTVSRSVLAHHSMGGAFSEGRLLVGQTTQITVAHSTISDANHALTVGASTGTAALLVADSNEMSANTDQTMHTTTTVAFFFNQSGGTETIFTLGNNDLVDWSAVSVGGTPTPAGTH